MDSPFDHPSYRWLFVGTAFSQFADWLKWIALLVSVYTMTPTLQGVVVLFLIGGIARWHGDIWSNAKHRSHPLRQMMKQDLLLVLGGIGIVAGVLLQDLILVYLFLYFTSLLSSIQTPLVAKVMPDVVSEKQVLVASSVLALIAPSAMVVGSLLAALLFPLLGGAQVLGIALLLQLLSMTCKAMVRTRSAGSREEEATSGYWETMVDGYRLVQQHPNGSRLLFFQLMRAVCFGLIVTAVIAVVLLRFDGSSGVGITYALMGLAYPLARLCLQRTDHQRWVWAVFALYIVVSAPLLWVSNWYVFLPLLFLGHLIHAILHMISEKVLEYRWHRESCRSLSALWQTISRGGQLLGIGVLWLIVMWMG